MEHGKPRALLLNVDKNLAVVSIKTNIVGNESNVPAGVADNLLVVYIGLSCNLSKDHDHVGLGAGFTGNLAVWVLLEAGVKDSIGDLITELVWVSLVHRLGGEKESLCCHFLLTAQQ
ncbi:hypothetical protein Ahy_B01g056449 [Arachis hypogaea]|uniref:Uncharacterized protein n=1 Tax=Arachis hypogaea TaxID=3818 RepID=A0A445AYW6_ARAHY|nr:hypothetical protein Ahy_B01g056449 [Arachis hypogaea]